MTTPTPCRVCMPRPGIAIVGCFDCRRCRTFASDVAKQVARKHQRATSHRTWLVLDQALVAPVEHAPTS